MTTRAYEIMIIVDGDEEDAKVDEIVQDVDAWIQGQNGQIAKTDKWGKRKFAYEINHKTEGEVTYRSSLCSITLILSAIIVCKNIFVCKKPLLSTLLY